MSIEYKVPEYDTEPSASDLVDDIFTSIQEVCLQPLAEKLRENDSINGSLVYRQVLSASHEELCKVLNILNRYKLNIKIADKLDEERKHIEAQF